MYRSSSARDWLIVVLFVALPCRAHAQAPLRAVDYVSGFSSPIAFVQDPVDRAVQFVVQQSGRIRVIHNGVVQPTDFLNLTSAIANGGERGLLGMAFAPDYASSGRFYVNFTNTSGNTVVARFKRSADPLVADAGSRFDLRWGGAAEPAVITQPFANHNGGHLAFGPDGFLYIGLGDGGSGGDPGNRAQNPAELLGKFLRVDVNVPDGDPIGYVVPADNPFVASGPAGTRQEIWSFGWRNPWRYSFDDPARGGTGALIVGDVGQGLWEEIDYEPANRGGRNYGWRNREGAHDYDTSLPPAYLPLVEPVHEYSHSDGHSVTGGFVYRGTALGSAYRGRYFFADFINGRVWSLGLAIDPVTGEATKTTLIEHTAELGGTSMLGNISSFGVDADGELLIVSYSRGVIIRVLGAPPDSGDFDEDGKADLAIYRPSSGTWYINNSASGFTTSTIRPFGVSTDLSAPGDYDRDGRTDLAFFRPSEGVWHILQSATDTVVTRALGTGGDIPVAGDYDGDGATDPAVYRPFTSTWYVLESSLNYTAAVTRQWPLDGFRGDTPVPGDYDGDGSTDHAVFRPFNGTWYIRKSSSGSSRTVQWGLMNDVPAPADYDGDGLTDLAVYRPETGVWFIRYAVNDFATSASFQWGLIGDVPAPADYDGDGKSELAVYRPSNGTWYIAQSATSYATSVTYQWGLAGDVPAPNTPVAHTLAARSTLATFVRASDFDGDRASDLTVYRPSNGTWYSLLSRDRYSTTRITQWGLSGDIPVPQDYDADGQTDFAVYRPSTGVWYSLFSRSQYTTSRSWQWGNQTDQPVPGDYDRDTAADPAVFRTAGTPTWYVLMSTSSYTGSTELQFGIAGDLPVPGDYNGDGRTDMTVYRPSNGMWHRDSGPLLQWGLSGDIPVPGDYDGDGKTDFAVYRPSTGEWYTLHSSASNTTFSQRQWGLSEDVPVPGDYDGDRKTDLAVWRPSTGVWYILKSSTNFTAYDQVQWGLPGDIPILKRP